MVIDNFTNFMIQIIIKLLNLRILKRLEKPFSEEEVFFALHELNGEKAPRLNGYTIAFWHFNWETVKGEVMAVFKDFFVSGKFVKSLNSTFIVMVPKKEGADDPKLDALPC